MTKLPDIFDFQSFKAMFKIEFCLLISWSPWIKMKQWQGTNFFYLGLKNRVYEDFFIKKVFQKFTSLLVFLDVILGPVISSEGW